MLIPKKGFKKPWKGGRGKRKLIFTYEDIARQRGVKIETIRKAVAQKILNPADLGSICNYIGDKRRVRDDK